MVPVPFSAQLPVAGLHLWMISDITYRSAVLFLQFDVLHHHKTLLVMTIWNFLWSLIFSTSSLNSTVNKRFDPIKYRISLNIFFSYISIFLRAENWPEVLVGQVLCWVVDMVPHDQKLVWKDSKLSSATMPFQWYFLWFSQEMFSFS